MSSTITFDAVTKSYPAGRGAESGSPAVDTFTARIEAGTTTVLLGSSGCGKTTLLRMVNRMVEPSSGRVLIDDEDVATRDAVALRRSIGYVMQNAGLLPHRRVIDNITLVPRLQGADRHDARCRALELMDMLDLDRDLAGRYPHQLSGGQLQRACIALAMACDPPVLIADEPTTALDVTVQAGILDLLRSLTRDEGVAVLLITHDMAVVADVADDVAVMRHGRIVERAAVREIFRKPRHEYTRELLAAVPRLDSLRQEDPFAAVARESEAPAKGAAELVVAVEGLNVVYRNGRRTVHAVHDASLTIAPGEVLGLVGESGSGKSTIAGTLTGLVPIASGSVRVDGVEVAGARRRDLLPVRRSTGVVYQNPASSLNPRRTVGASIAEPMLIHGGFDSPARRARVRELLEAVRLPAAMAERYPHEMSGGQRQRVAIARALALDPRLVIADEPTSALDVSVQAVVLDLLRALQAELGFACLFVSHDLAVVDSIAARTVVLNGGRVVESGPTEQVLARPREDYTRRLVMAVPVPDPAVQAARRERRRALKAVEGVHA